MAPRVTRETLALPGATGKTEQTGTTEPREIPARQAGTVEMDVTERRARLDQGVFLDLLVSIYIFAGTIKKND